MNIINRLVDEMSKTRLTRASLVQFDSSNEEIYFLYYEPQHPNLPSSQTSRPPLHFMYSKIRRFSAAWRRFNLRCIFPAIGSFIFAASEPSSRIYARRFHSRKAVKPVRVIRSIERIRDIRPPVHTDDAIADPRKAPVSDL